MMRYYDAAEGFPSLLHSAVTLGKFDGIHRGHKKLIDQILLRKEKGETAVVVAFVTGQPMLFDSRERRHCLEALGVDVLIECPLSDKIRMMSAENFVEEILIRKLDMVYVAVGEEFRFGCERKGDSELLKALGEQWGFQAEILEREMDGERKISSTYIKEELAVGNMEKVSELLGRNFVVEGKVEHGRGMGHKNFVPTINLVPSPLKLMPPCGVYTSLSGFSLKISDEESQDTPKENEFYKTGITNVGYKPTIGEDFLGVETFLFQCNEDLYDRYCSVELLHFQRPEQKFPSFEALKARIDQDQIDGELYFKEFKCQKV